MTKNDIADKVGSATLLGEAEQHYAGALEDMMVMRRYFRDRTDISEAEIKRVSGNYIRATQTLFDERKKVEELSRRNAGIHHDHAIDFDSVRSEIGGLLDRLRAVRGPM